MTEMVADAKAAEVAPPWLAELNAKYGEPRVAHPAPVRLGDRKRQCWVWFPGGENYNLGIDQFPDRWVVRSARPGGNGELIVYGKERPTDAAIRGVLVTAGLLDDPMRFFLLDPDTSYELVCPDCSETVSIAVGTVFQGYEGTALGHEPTLGDLIDAAGAHECTREFV